MKKGNVIFPEGRTLLYYMVLPTGRKLVDSQGDPTAGTLKATASEVGPVELKLTTKINRWALFGSIADLGRYIEDIACFALKIAKIINTQPFVKVFLISRICL